MLSIKQRSSINAEFLLPIAFLEGIGGTYNPGNLSDKDSLSASKSLYLLYISNFSLFNTP